MHNCMRRATQASVGRCSTNIGDGRGLNRANDLYSPCRVMLGRGLITRGLGAKMKFNPASIELSDASHGREIGWSSFVERVSLLENVP